jgi:hypothetical protein
MPDEAKDTPRAWLLAALAVFAAGGLVEVASRPMNGDASWYVYVAGRLLDGDRPYVDLVDTNPPLILWLNMGVVVAARTIGAAPLRAFLVTVFGVIGVSLALAWRTSRGLPRTLRETCLAGFGFMLFIGVGPGFGQREHLAVALILPYAFAASAEARGERPPRGLAIVTGLLAGIGFSLKPFFVFPAAAVELWLAARRGWRVGMRPQALAMAGVFLVYGLLIALLTPQYFAVARRLAPLYPAHNPMGSTLVANSWRLAIVVSGAALAWRVCRRRAPGFVEVFLLLDAWLTVAIYLTGKGWDYHWFPALAFSWSLAISAAALLVEPLAARHQRLAAIATACLILAPVALSIQETRSRMPDRETGRLVRAGTREGDAVFVLSPWLHKAFPLVVEERLKWGMRYPMLLQVAAFYPEGSWSPGRYHADGAMAEEERRFKGEVVADFLKNRPAVLLVDDDPPTPLHRGFRYLDYFGADPAFARAMRDYERVGQTPSFVVYRRRGVSPALSSRRTRTSG